MNYKGVALLAGVAIVLGLIGVRLRFGEREPLHSDAATVRTNVIYAAAYEKPKELLAEPKDFFASFDFKEGEDEIVVRMPVLAGSVPGPAAIPERTYQAQENTVRLEPEGSIALAFVGTLHSVPMATNVGPALQFGAPRFHLRSAEAPFRLYRADGRAATLKELQELIPGHSARAQLQDHYPLGRFYFSARNVPSLRPPIRLQVFDARTKWPLTETKNADGEAGGLFWFDMAVRAWHQTPLELVMTVDHASEKEQTAPARVGEDLFLGGNHARIVAIKPGMFVVARSTTENGSEVLNLRKAKADERGPVSSVVLQTWQTEGGILQVDFVDANGEKIPKLGSGKTRHISVFHVKAEVQNIRSIRVRMQPRVERLVFHLPELPGLPAEHRGLTNLADVRVPYAFFGDEVQFERDVRNLLQISGHHVPLRYPAGFFPMERTNVTVKELFLEMERMLKQPDGRLEIDGENHALSVQKEPVKKMVRRLRIKLKD